MEMSRSWSSAHDWKSCRGQKLLESSNLSISAMSSQAAYRLRRLFYALHQKVISRSLRCSSFPQKVTLGSPVRLQAPSRRLAVATNLLRVTRVRIHLSKKQIHLFRTRLTKGRKYKFLKKYLREKLLGTAKIGGSQ